MTNQEAIKIIKNERECVQRAVAGCNRDCLNCDLLKPEKEIFEAYALVIKAMKKQIPKKTKCTFIRQQSSDDTNASS